MSRQCRQPELPRMSRQCRQPELPRMSRQCRWPELPRMSRQCRRPELPRMSGERPPHEQGAGVLRFCSVWGGGANRRWQAHEQEPAACAFPEGQTIPTNPRAP